MSLIFANEYYSIWYGQSMNRTLSVHIDGSCLWNTFSVRRFLQLGVVVLSVCSLSFGPFIYMVSLRVTSLHRVVREGRITHTSLTLCRLVSDFTYSVMVGQWLYIPCGGWSVTLHTLWWLVSDFVYSVVVGQWLNILCDGWPVTLCTLWWLVSDFTYSVMVGQWLHILWPFFS